ncbi:hypothetical protein CEK60_00390 [Halomonas sp. N3-2A]|nr:hypothetical protein CEK60_00390 [Halomonas sp. N3-2A]
MEIPLSNRATISKVDVFSVANDLQAAGTNPTASNIRAKLKRGSFSTIQAHLEAWRQESDKAEESGELPSAIQGYLTTLATELWQRAQVDAKADLARIREALEAERNAVLKEADKAITKAEVLQESVAGLELKLKQTQRQCQEVRTDLALSRQEGAQLLRERQHAEERMDELETQNERLHSNLEIAERDLAKVTASEQTFKTRYEDVKAQNDQQKATLARLNKQLDQLSVSHRTVSEERDDARSKAQQAIEDGHETKQALAVIEQRFKDIQARYDKLNKAHATLVNERATCDAKVAHLEQQLENEQTTLSHLQLEMVKLQQAHYEQTGTLTTIKEELRYAQRALYLRDKDK